MVKRRDEPPKVKSEPGPYVGARVPLEHALELEELARDNDRTVAAELRIAIRRHLELERAA